MTRKVWLSAAMIGVALPAVSWAQSSAPALSASQIADMLKPGAGTTEASDLLSASDLAAILKPEAGARATRSLSAGGDVPKPEAGQPGSGTVNLQINFGTNSAKISPQARGQLRELGQAMQFPQLQDLRFKIAGHTDARGSAEANKVLSQKRAEAVVSYLVSQYAIAPGRLQAMGYGEEELIDPADPANWKNRRVEVSAEQ